MFICEQVEYQLKSMLRIGIVLSAQVSQVVNQVTANSIVLRQTAVEVAQYLRRRHQTDKGSID